MQWPFLLKLHRSPCACWLCVRLTNCLRQNEVRTISSRLCPCLVDTRSTDSSLSRIFTASLLIPNWPIWRKQCQSCCPVVRDRREGRVFCRWDQFVFYFKLHNWPFPGSNAWWLAHLSKNSDVDTTLAQVVAVSLHVPSGNLMLMINRLVTRSSVSGPSVMSTPHLRPRIPIPTKFIFVSLTPPAHTSTTVPTVCSVSITSFPRPKSMASSSSFLSLTTGATMVASKHTPPLSAPTLPPFTPMPGRRKRTRRMWRLSSQDISLALRSLLGSCVMSHAARDARHRLSRTGRAISQSISRAWMLDIWSR